MKPKLVRDNIPEIIRKSGRTPVTHIAKCDEAKEATIAKVFEELSEFQQVPCLEEAADVYQAFMMMIKVHDLRFDDVKRSLDRNEVRHGIPHSLLVGYHGPGHLVPGSLQIRRSTSGLRGMQGATDCALSIVEVIQQLSGRCEFL